MSYGGDFFRKYKDTLEEISQKTDMHIIVEHVSAVALDEGPEEIAAVINAIRKLGRTGEGKQWAAAQGLDIDSMSDRDIRNKIIVPMGRGAASMLSQIPRGSIDMSQVKKGLDALDTRFVGSYAKDHIASQAPKGRFRSSGAAGIKPADIDVDISGYDIDKAKEVLDNLSAKFPKAREMFDQGRFRDALSQVYRRMAKDDPSTPQ
jgi:hypothetical protein